MPYGQEHLFKVVDNIIILNVGNEETIFYSLSEEIEIIKTNNSF